MKTLLRILNIVYFLIAGAAVAVYAINFIQPDTLPFLKVGFKAELNETNSKEVFSDEMLSDFGVSRHDLFSSGDIEVEAKVTVTNQLLFDVWSASDDKTYLDENFINPNIDKLVDQIEPAFEKVAKQAAKSSIKSQIESIGGGNTSFYSTLYDNGHGELNESKMESDADRIVDALTADGATIESVNAVYNEVYNTYSEALGNGTKTVAETKEELQDILDKYNLVDEEGNITSIDDAIAALLNNMLNGEESNDSNEDGDGESSYIKLNRIMHPLNEEGSEATNESAIANELKTFINSKFDSSNLAIGLKIAGICWAVFVLAWAIKILQCIICLFRKTPYVRVEIIGIIAGIVQVVLALISGLLLLAFTMGFIDTFKALPLIGPFISSVPFLGSEGIGLEMTFSALIPGILVLVNFVFSIFYGFAKRSFKRSI